MLCVTFQGLAPETTESNIYDYQEIMLVVYVLSNDILLKPIRPLVERIGWPIIARWWPIIDFYSIRRASARRINERYVSARSSSVPKKLHYTT